MADENDGATPPDPRPAAPRLVLVPRADREERAARKMARDAFFVEVRTLALRGMGRSEIAQKLNRRVRDVSREYKRVRRELSRNLTAEEREHVKREALARFELLFKTFSEDYERSRVEPVKETVQEMLKDRAGAVRGSRVLVKTLPPRPNDKLGRLILEATSHMCELLGLLTPAAQVSVNVEQTKLEQRNVFVLTPSRPLDLEKLQRLNAVIKGRSNGGLPPVA